MYHLNFLVGFSTHLYQFFIFEHLHNVIEYFLIILNTFCIQIKAISIETKIRYNILDSQIRFTIYYKILLSLTLTHQTSYSHPTNCYSIKWFVLQSFGSNSIILYLYRTITPQKLMLIRNLKLNVNLTQNIYNNPESFITNNIHIQYTRAKCMSDVCRNSLLIKHFSVHKSHLAFLLKY